ncbi:MAG: 2-dehydropantoate 2-reductase, partial [Polyangiaceae bacterium]
MNDRILIVGCGGLGGIVAGTLLEHAKSNELPLDLTVLTTNTSVADTVNARGFVLRGDGGAKTVAGKMVTALSPHDSFGTIILATQPPQVEDAARRVSPHLHESGKIVCLQNGLCEERVAHIAPREQVVGAVVAWGGAMPEPGVYDR